MENVAQGIERNRLLCLQRNSYAMHTYMPRESKCMCIFARQPILEMSRNLFSRQGTDVHGRIYSPRKNEKKSNEIVDGKIRFQEKYGNLASKCCT